MDATTSTPPSTTESDVAATSLRQRRHSRSLIVAVGGALLALITWAAFVPISFDSREELFDIPKGTWARRMAGDKRDILPAEIHLIIGVRDILVLKNSDEVPQIVGPTLLMPGQTFRLPFSIPSENYFTCTAHSNGQLAILVEEAPAAPWTRLRWRTRKLLAWASEP